VATLGTDADKSEDEKEPEYKGRKLSEWVDQFRNGDLGERQGAVLALGKLGPKAIPVLAAALQDKELVNVRAWAAAGLRANGPSAKAAVPQLEAALKDEVGYVRIEAADALWAISEHKSAIPTFIELLKSGEASDRWIAAERLNRIGPKAKAAVPALFAALKDPGIAEFGTPTGVEKKPVSDAARKALINIDPEAAEKAGIK
jgi:HEAT repeat protein